MISSMASSSLLPTPRSAPMCSCIAESGRYCTRRPAALAAWQACRRLAMTVVAAAGWSAESGWTLHTVDGEDHPASLASFRVLGDLVWLRMQSAQHGICVLLLAPDNSDADLRRRLRMRLAAAC